MTTRSIPQRNAKRPRLALRKHRLGRIILWIFAAIVALAICARPMLPWAVRWYVDRTLNHNLIYEGRVGDVSLHLWRGAYSISNIRIFKRTGDVPEPLLSLKTLDLAIQWNAILHHKVVGVADIEQPVLHFVASSDQSEDQTGAGGAWLDTLRKLFPLQLNRVEIHDGSIHFHSYVRATPVDVYLSHLEASVDDLTNIRNQTTPLLTTVDAHGLAMNEAKFELHMKLNPFAYYPTFEMTARLLGLDVTKLNDLSHTYGQFTFKEGWFDLVMAAKAEDGQMSGYIKPLFRHLRIFDPGQDLATDDNPLQFFWQAVLGVVTTALKNQPRDQFATMIPFSGDMQQPDAGYLEAVGNVLQNAFIRAYLPRLNDGTQQYDGMTFDPGSIVDPNTNANGEEP
jgi:Domain of Unknown Function (DUF748)